MDNLITGLHGIEEALKAGKVSGVLYLSRKNARIDGMKDLAAAFGLQIRNLPPAEMNRRFGENRGAVLQLYGDGRTGTARPGKAASKSSSGRSAGILPFEEAVDELDSGNILIIVLDGVTDPHNYGAILRSADQFGADLVVHAARRSASGNDTVARTSAGAVNYVPVSVVKNLGRAVDYLKKRNVWVYGADMSGSPAENTELSGRTAIVMGSEGKGLSRLVSEKCDSLISIPSSGRVDSLNVSVAAGILMYEARRQQRSGS